jgi:hypothetical protein
VSRSQSIARRMVFSTTHGVEAALFFTSFIILCAIVLINVVVAVLLDKMMDSISPTGPVDREELAKQ